MPDGIRPPDFAAEGGKFMGGVLDVCFAETNTLNTLDNVAQVVGFVKQHHNIGRFALEGDI